MKKYISVLVSAALAVTLCACGSSAQTLSTTAAQASSEKAAEAPKDSAEEAAENGEEKELKIVTTIFPEYDWVREVLGEEISHAELTMLLDSGVDLHSFQPSAADIPRAYAPATAPTPTSYFRRPHTSSPYRRAASSLPVTPPTYMS